MSAPLAIPRAVHVEDGREDDVEAEIRRRARRRDARAGPGPPRRPRPDAAHAPRQERRGYRRRRDPAGARRLKRLLLLPFLCAAVAGVGMALSDAAAPRYYQVLLILAALSTALSAFATTSRFAPGDNLFLSWLFVGIGYSFSTIRYSIRLIALLTGTTLLPSVALNTMLVLQNLAIVIALLMFVRAW